MGVIIHNDEETKAMYVELRKTSPWIRVIRSIACWEQGTDPALQL